MSKRFVNMIILGAILAGLLMLGIGHAEETAPAPAAASPATPPPTQAGPVRHNYGQCFRRTRCKSR